MKKLSKTILTILVLAGFGIQSSVADEAGIKRANRTHHRVKSRKAHKLRFKTRKEYQQMKSGSKMHSRRIHKNETKSSRFIHNKREVRTGHIRDGYDNNYRRGPSQQGYRHYKRGWYLAYRYDKAHFYDRYGYEYGYFNKYGFEFDGTFYSYDRRYRYRDRMRGRGIFGPSYYAPANAKEYGFAYP